MARTEEEGVNCNENSIKINKLNINNNISHESEDASNSETINNNDNNVEDIDMDQTSSTDKSALSLNQSSDANQSKSSTISEIKTDIKVFFVEVKSVGRQPKSMQLAFTSMKSYKFSPNWIKEEEVFENEWCDNSDNLLFILDSFDGKVFEYLLSKKLRIISALTVLYCYSKQCPKPYKSIPVKPFPIFSQCMRKLFVSISGFDGQKKQEMISKITRMCGNFCKDFTKNVTHLVTDSVRSKKYKVAKEKGVAVVSALWIDECWTDSQHRLMSASDKEFVHRFQLKIFNNLLITVSQIDVEERKQIERLVVDNGGQYSPSLKLNDQNSMLLLRSPEGEKFKYAHMRGVPCLNIQWLYDSQDKGYALPEEDYLIRPSSQSSQKFSQTKPKPLNDNQINTISSTDLSQTADNSSQVLIEKINKLVADRSDEPFLEGCDIFIVGFSRSVFEAIKSALILSGSMVYNEFKNLVTHVIVSHKCVDTDLEQFFDNKSCKVVDIEWLLECFRRNECCDCSSFELKNPKCVIKNASNVSLNKSTNSDIFEGPLTVVCPKTAHIALEKWKEDSKINTKLNHKSLGDRMNDKNDIQWNDEEVEDMPSQRPYIEEVGENTHNIEVNDNRLDSKSEEKGTDDKSDDKTEDIEVIEIEPEKSEDSNDSLPKKLFLFSGYDDIVKNDLVKIVEDLNGTVIDSNNVLDCVTHLVIRDPSATEKTLSAIAAGVWLIKEDYLYESKTKGRFISEEDFEWGYDISNGTDAKSIRKRLMISAVNWRIHLKERTEKEERRVKAFDDWNIIFLYPTKMTLPYTQVFRAANANVIQLTPDFDLNRLNQIKYAFIDHKSIDDIPKYVLKIGKLLTKMEKLHKLDFISHYIVNGPDSDLTTFHKKTLITDKFWDSIQDSQQSRKRVRDDSFGEASHSSAKQRK